MIPGPVRALHGAADQALADPGETLQPLEARLAELDRQRPRAAMGAEAFEAEYAAGRALALSGRSLISRSPGGPDAVCSITSTYTGKSPIPSP